MNYATLMHGEPDEVIAELDSQVDLVGVTMALVNALTRIARLEAALRAAQVQDRAAAGARDGD